MPDAAIKLFVSFVTEGMARRFSYFNDDLIGLIVDVKQDVCAEKGVDIATLLGASKDKLRNTTFGTNASGKRVQGRVDTNHGQLILQGVHNASCFSKLRVGSGGDVGATKLLRRDDEGLCPWNRSSSQDCVWQWPCETVERRVSHATGAEALTIVVDSTNNLIKTFPQPAARKPNPFGLDHQQLDNKSAVPTLDSCSEIQQANLDRIQHEFGEIAAAEYLGNSNDSYYTERRPVDILVPEYGMVRWNPDRKYELSFAYNW